jgi:hypothetical protein
MSIQSWKWRNIDSTCQFIIFSGNYSARSSQNALQWVNCRNRTRFPDLLWRYPSYGQVGSPSNPDCSTETPECLPDIHEGLGRVEWRLKNLLITKTTTPVLAPDLITGFRSNGTVIFCHIYGYFCIRRNPLIFIKNMTLRHTCAHFLLAVLIG